MAAEGSRPIDHLTKIVGLFVAPSTLLTGLLYYFGWAKTYAQMAYFGVDSSVLSMSVREYVLRSADAVFVPAASVVAVMILLQLLLIGFRRWGLSRRVVRAVTTTVVASGAVIIVFGGISAFVRQMGPYILIPLSLTVGTATIAAGTYLHHSIVVPPVQPREATSLAASGLRTAVWTCTMALIVLSTFWTVAIYATNLGRERAEWTAARLSERISVSIFSQKRLNIEGPGVVEAQSVDSESLFQYAYSGLRLLIHSNGKYFLLPTCWSPQSGHTVVIPYDDSLRFEFGRESQPCD